MPAPNEYQKIGSKEKAVRAAAGLFHANGYVATSVDDILRKAGVTKSNFYYHFRSKEALGISVLDFWEEQAAAERLEPTLYNDSLRPLERLRALGDALITFMESTNCSGGCPFGNWTLELADGWPEFRKRLSASFNRFTERVSSIIREGQQAGEIIDHTSPNELAAMYLAQLQGALLLCKAHKNTNPIQQTFDAAFALMATPATSTTEIHA